MAVRQTKVEQAVNTFFDACRKEKMTNEELGAMIQGINEKYKQVQNDVFAQWLNEPME